MRTVATPFLPTAVAMACVACGGNGAPFTPGDHDEFDGGEVIFVGSGGSGGFSRDGSAIGDGSVPGDGGSLGDDGGGSPSADDGGNLDGSSAGDGDAGSGVTITFNAPPGFFPSLDWTIAGPAGHYMGTILFGDAHSYEFVVGGIQRGDGYTIALQGQDVYGDPCSGTSSPFTVTAGAVAGATVVIDCHTRDARAADVTTGSVGVDASVVLSP